MAIKSFYENGYGLRGNPFPGKATYAEDVKMIYVPEMFGSQREDFMRKFVLAPLENGQPLIGAVWSVVPGDPEARGFGKSTLMGEEAKQINHDFGQATLRSLGVPENEVKDNPILAGYVAFNSKAQGGIANIDAAAFHLVRFILRGVDRDGNSIHQRLNEMALTRLMEKGAVAPGGGKHAIVEAIKSRFRELSVSIDIRNLLEQFVFHLADKDTDALERFLSDDVGTWHHDRNGLKYLQIFVVFAELAGIQHFTFFIDQVEDFTSSAGAAKIQKNVKIIRDALFEAEPFSSRASFVFQLHPDAYEKLRNAWLHEDLRSLEWDDPLNKSVVIVLTGLEEFDQARLLVERMLNDPSVALPNHKGGISPFTESALELVWEATKPRPRWFLRVLHDLLALGKEDKISPIDDAFVTPLIDRLSEAARTSEDDLISATDSRLK